MKTNLIQFAKNKYSQFGEDGMLEHLLQRLGISTGFCVEFGAGDGISCSNTKALRDAGWDSILIEADKKLFERIDQSTCPCIIREKVTPAGNASIDSILQRWAFEKPVDFMSIDVDGDDYYIFEQMQTRPKIVCIEFNCSVPPHLALVGEQGGCFGASARALQLLAEKKGYFLIGITTTNAFFIDNQFREHFFTKRAVIETCDYVNDLPTLMQDRTFAYVVTDYKGRGHLTSGSEHTYWGWGGLKNPVQEQIRELRAPA